MVVMRAPIRGPRKAVVPKMPEVEVADGGAGGVPGERLFHAVEKTRTSVPVFVFVSVKVGVEESLPWSSSWFGPMVVLVLVLLGEKQTQKVKSQEGEQVECNRT